MPQTLQAKKRVRQSLKQRLQNSTFRSTMRTHLKKVRIAIDQKQHSEAQLAYQKVVSIIDRMARKNLIHANKAARYKSRLNARIKALI